MIRLSRIRYLTQQNCFKNLETKTSLEKPNFKKLNSIKLLKLIKWQSTDQFTG